MILVLSDEERKRRFNARSRKWAKENPEKVREAKKKYARENPEKTKESTKKYAKSHPEEVREMHRRWSKKNPSANTMEMTKYRRKHKECEWSNGICKSLNEQKKLPEVHHILPKHKYPKYIDGDYNGRDGLDFARKGNNFICYCSFHHYAYHFVYASKRNNKKHESAFRLLQYNLEKWINANKISYEDLMIELARMY